MTASITASTVSAVRIGAGRQLARRKIDIFQLTIYIYLSDGARFYVSKAVLYKMDFESSGESTSGGERSAREREGRGGERERGVWFCLLWWKLEGIRTLDWKCEVGSAVLFLTLRSRR